MLLLPCPGRCCCLSALEKYAVAREPLTVVVAAPCTWLYRLGAASTRPAAHLPSSFSYDFLLLATAETQEPVFKSIATMQF